VAGVSLERGISVPKEDYRKIIVELSRERGGSLEVFSDFCRIAACTLACETREEEYLEVSKRYKKEEIFKISIAFAGLITEMEDSPFTDILGPFYTEINSRASATARGEFYTPPEISQVMARMLFGVGQGGGEDSGVETAIERGTPITVSDPSCGSGGMVLALAQQFAPKKAVDLLRVSLIDISPIACDMAYINTTLWGIPAQITQGNALSGQFVKICKNIHWFRVDEDGRLRANRMLEMLKTGFSSKKEQEVEVPNIGIPKQENLLDEKGRIQMDLNF